MRDFLGRFLFLEKKIGNLKHNIFEMSKIKLMMEQILVPNIVNLTSTTKITVKYF